MNNLQEEIEKASFATNSVCHRVDVITIEDAKRIAEEYADARVKDSIWKFMIKDMEELQKRMDDITSWADETFGKWRQPHSIINHLAKEVLELIEALQNEPKPKVDAEFADCMILLLNAASKWGLTAEQLIQEVDKKMVINKGRKWGKPDEHGVVEHIRTDHPLSMTREQAEHPERKCHPTVVTKSDGQWAYCLFENGFWYQINIYDSTHPNPKLWCRADEAISWRGLSSMDF